MTKLEGVNFKMELQEASYDIYKQKYQLRGNNGAIIDKDVDATLERVAFGLAELEPKNQNKKEHMYWKNEFKWALDNGAVPAGRILANCGAGEHKKRTSTINCLVSENIRDSIDGIGQGVHQAMVSLSTGAGMGFCFSLLRPKGAYVNGVGASTSGPLSFADIYDTMCKTISSAGGRRGAMMLTFHVHHPDIIDVIRCKREKTRLRQFNISVLVTKEFMEAVKNDDDWQLYFPYMNEDKKSIDLIWRDWPVHEDNYQLDAGGKTLCKVYKTMKARELYELIMQSDFNYNDPGFILIDKVNELNNNYFCEITIATNPCGR